MSVNRFLLVYSQFLCSHVSSIILILVIILYRCFSKLSQNQLHVHYVSWISSLFSCTPLRSSAHLCLVAHELSIIWTDFHHLVRPKRWSVARTEPIPSTKCHRKMSILMAPLNLLKDILSNRNMSPGGLLLVTLVSRVNKPWQVNCAVRELLNYRWSSLSAIQKWFHYAGV